MYAPSRHLFEFQMLLRVAQSSAESKFLKVKKAYRRSGGIAPFIDGDGDEWSVSRPSRLTPAKAPRYTSAGYLPL
jgi:hypothetical protein